MAEKEPLSMRFTGRWTSPGGSECTVSIIAGLSRGDWLVEDDEDSGWDDDKPKPVWFIRKWSDGKRVWFGEVHRREDNLWDEDEVVLKHVRRSLADDIIPEFDSWSKAHRERVLKER